MTGLMTCALSLQTCLPLNRALTLEEKSATTNGRTKYSGSGAPYTPGLSLPMHVDAVRLAVLSKLAELAKLEDGWYDQDSVGISPLVIERSRNVIERALQAGLPKPELTPTLHGTISVEWETINASVYLEIGRTKMNGFLRTRGNEPTLISDVNVLPDMLYSDLNSIISPKNPASIALPASVDGQKYSQAA